MPPNRYYRRFPLDCRARCWVPVGRIPLCSLSGGHESIVQCARYPSTGRHGAGKHYFLKMVTSTTAVSIATVLPTPGTSAAPRAKESVSPMHISVFRGVCSRRTGNKPPKTLNDR
jgi:hypothetical protein